MTDPVDPQDSSPPSAAVPPDSADTPQASGPAIEPAAESYRWPRAVGAALIVVAAWGVLALWGLGSAPFHTKGEPREALVVWEMTHDGGWILPKRNGVELPSKPPLFHWLGAATSRAANRVDEWSIRFPSALLSLLGALMVLVAGTAWWSARAGLLSALTLMTSFEWARAATNARVDMTLTFGLEVAALSLMAFWRSRRSGWLVPLYLGIAWAVLGKGPVGVALPAITTVLLILMTFERDARQRDQGASLIDWSALWQMHLVRGAVVVAVLAGSWYAMALYVGGWPFFRKQILAENLFTFLDDADFGGGHRHGLLYLPGQLLLGLLPWTLFLPGLAVAMWKQRDKLSRRDPRVLLLVWTLVVLTFYQIAASKRGVYLLAAYPSVALLLGWWWHTQWERIGADRWLALFTEWICTVLAAVLGAGVLLALLAAAGVPVLNPIQRWVAPKSLDDVMLVGSVLKHCGGRLAVGLLLTAIGVMVARQSARRVHWSWVFSSLVAAVSTLLVSVRLVAMPSFAELVTQRDFMEAVRRAAGAQETVWFYQTFDYGAVYYSKGHIPQFDGAWPQDGPRFVLVQQAFWETNRAALREFYEAVGLDSQTPAGEDALTLLRRIETPAAAPDPALQPGT